MKYKTKIVPEGTGYVGYALLNDQVVFTSSVQNDTLLIVREVSQYIAAQSKQPIKFFPPRAPKSPMPPPPPRNLMQMAEQSPAVNQTVPIEPNSAPTITPVPQRRCCGRG